MAQAAHVVVGFVWAWGVTWLIFTVAKRFMKIRVTPEVELEGLDMPEFGASVLPRLRAGHHQTGGQSGVEHRRWHPRPAAVGGHEPAGTGPPPPSATDRDLGRPA